MQKGLRTRGSILASAAPVFNMRGFFGTSVEDLVKATGLKKGGLYNHYPSKEVLALAAFDYAIGKFRERYAEVAVSKTRAMDRLLAIPGVMLRNYEDPVVAGGCMVMNTAIEADDAHPVLRAKSQEAMSDLLRFIGLQVKLGIRSGELRKDVDARAVAALIVSTCEGALMLSKLFADATYIRRASAHMSDYIRSLQA